MIGIFQESGQEVWPVTGRQDPVSTQPLELLWGVPRHSLWDRTVFPSTVGVLPELGSFSVSSSEDHLEPGLASVGVCPQDYYIQSLMLGSLEVA